MRNDYLETLSFRKTEPFFSAQSPNLPMPWSVDTKISSEVNTHSDSRQNYGNEHNSRNWTGNENRYENLSEETGD